MADAYLNCLGSDPEDYNWTNKTEWKSFELACIESYGEDNKWLVYAKKGILCHHGALLADVRLPLERLMRNDKPLVIISTSTLGQGVNLGVSSVVFSTIYQAGEKISARDFWNIAGRAGRAFVDHEGKILIAIDSSNHSRLFNSIIKYKDSHPITYKRLKAKILENAIKQAKSFFNKEEIDIATSGILALVKTLYKVASDEGIELNTLLQLIAEIKLKRLAIKQKRLTNYLIGWTTLYSHYKT